MRELYEGVLAQPLIDDALWAPLEDAIEGASSSLSLTQLFFEPGFSPRRRPLTDLLENAASRGVRVRILVNENAAIPDSFDELSERFHGTGVEVRALTMTPNVLHMKVLIIDDARVFMLDAPFEQRYVDSSSHVRDARYREHSKPLHSVSLRLEGPCVARIRDLYEAAWRRAGDEPAKPLPERPSRGEVRGPLSVRLAWTSPGGLLQDAQSEAIVEAYEDAIGRAKDFVYIENQYFTSPRILRALRKALAREPALEVILALNVHMDVPSYDTWQARRLEELAGFEGRVGAFALWSPARHGDLSLRQVYIHSKVCIVDDEWATVGSANLDSISLHDAEEFLVPVAPNVELNVVVPDARWAQDLRRRLWAEHLGDEGVWTPGRPPLSHWRRVAEKNLAAFEAEEGRFTGRVFPHGALAKEWRKPLFARRKGKGDG